MYHGYIDSFFSMRYLYKYCSILISLRFNSRFSRNYICGTMDLWKTIENNIVYYRKQTIIWLDIDEDTR